MRASESERKSKRAREVDLPSRFIEDDGYGEREREKTRIDAYKCTRSLSLWLVMSLLLAGCILASVCQDDDDARSLDCILILALSVSGPASPSPYRFPAFLLFACSSRDGVLMLWCCLVAVRIELNL